MKGQKRDVLAMTLSPTRLKSGRNRRAQSTLGDQKHETICVNDEDFPAENASQGYGRQISGACIVYPS